MPSIWITSKSRPERSDAIHSFMRTADRLRILIHHLGKGLHAGSQAKQLEARRNVRQGLQLQRSRRDGSRCSKFVHGVAFLCGISTPSLPAQGEQRRLSFFNIDRDNPTPNEGPISDGRPPQKSILTLSA